MTADLSKEALDALVYRLRRWDITDDDKEKAADAITALRAEVEAGIAARNLLGTKWAAAEDRTIAAEAARDAAMAGALAEMEAEREALVAATLERAANLCDDTAKEALDESGVCSRVLHVWFAGQAKHLRALATQPQTDALAARDRAMRAEGMRKAAEIACYASFLLHTNRVPDYSEVRDADTMAFAEAQLACVVREIKTAAEKEAGHD